MASKRLGLKPENAYLNGSDQGSAPDQKAKNAEFAKYGSPDLCRYGLSGSGSIAGLFKLQRGLSLVESAGTIVRGGTASQASDRPRFVVLLTRSLGFPARTRSLYLLGNLRENGASTITTNVEVSLAAGGTYSGGGCSDCG